MANRILLADDSITIQKVVNLTFADEGIEVVAVSNGDQAERRLADVQPDLVLADIFMPGKNGYELCEAIKESGQYHHIPVVLLVGAFEPFDQAEARRVKADAHLTKPFESRTLVETVRRLISASGQPRTGPLPPLPAPDAKAEPNVVSPLTPQMVTPVAPPADSRPAPMAQPFNIDMPLMGDPVAPPAPPMMAATTPLNFNYGSDEDPLGMPIEVQVGDAPAGQTAFAPQGHVIGRTDDLSFAESQPPFESFGLDDLFTEPAADYGAHGSGAGESASPHEAGGQEGGFAVPSTFGYATEEMLLDLEQPTPTMARAAQEPFAFDLEGQESASIDASGIQPDTSGGEAAAGAVPMQTTLLETPPVTAPVEAAVNTNPLAMPGVESADESGETPFAAAAVDSTALFNVDDPLGDVLDEAMPAAAPAASFESASAASPEAPPMEAAAAEVAAQPEAPAVSGPPVDYDVEFPAEPLAAAAPEPLADASIFTMDEPEVGPVPATDTGFGFTPVEAPDAAEATPRAPEGGFTTASMWTNEEARFAAIDIEATPVEEPAEAAASERPAEAAESFVAADDSSAYITHAEMPAMRAASVAEAPAAPAAEEASASAPAAQDSQATSAAPAVELSPALVDEIVRRVVARMSESVVREIAWEVVPDCVERVIKEMTAQEVAKR